MLVDLARNDVNRVCDPLSTRVDKLMVVQKVRDWLRGVEKGAIGVLMASSFHMYSIWCRKCLGCCGRARRDSTRSDPSFQQVRQRGA